MKQFFGITPARRENRIGYYILPFQLWATVPDFYISFDSQEGIEYFNNFKITIFGNFGNFKKNQNFKNLMTAFCGGGSFQ